MTNTKVLIIRLFMIPETLSVLTNSRIVNKKVGHSKTKSKV